MQTFAGKLQINLSAIRHNWRALRDAFGGETCGAVVKANAYGLGYAPVSQVLFSEGCRTFFVANFEEGVALKKLVNGCADIFVLQGCPQGMEAAFLEAQLIPVLISFSMAQRWCRQADLSRAPYAIKVNSGMNRLGLSVGEFDIWLRDFADASPPKMLLSHLACADQSEHPLNLQQLERFEIVAEKAKQCFPGVRISLANSAGIFLGDAWHFDVARPGIALYGGREGIPQEVPIRPVVTLSLPVIQLRDLKVGEWVGYGATFQADRPMRVAVVGGGYADGLLRAFSGRAMGSFAGVPIPLLGRVSMDSCVFDVTSVADSADLREGDFIEVFGAQSDLTAQAGRAYTISYELLTRLGERLTKFYIEE